MAGHSLTQSGRPAPIRAIRALGGFGLVLALVSFGIVAALRLEARGDVGRAAGLSARIDAAMFVGPDGRDVWETALSASVDPAYGPPDLPLARSVALSLVSMAGKDALALESLHDARADPGELEAQLRGLPAWRRERVLTEALEARLDQSHTNPPELAFASAALRARLARAEALYGPAYAQAESWFIDPAGRALALDSLAGLSGGVLQGGPRDLVIEGCALARSARRAPGACSAAPATEPDAAAAGLSVIEAGLAGEARIGARLLKAALRAGLADRSFAERLVFGERSGAAGETLLLESIATVLVVADEAMARPLLTQDVARAASDAFRERVPETDLGRIATFEAFAAVYRSEGAAAAIRTAGVVRSARDAVALAEIAYASEGRLLALHARLGDDLLTIREYPSAPGSSSFSHSH